MRIILLSCWYGACKSPSRVRTSGRQTGTAAKANGHEAGVRGRFEKEHGEMLAQMAAESAETSHDQTHTRERGSDV